MLVTELTLKLTTFHHCASESTREKIFFPILSIGNVHNCISLLWAIHSSTSVLIIHRFPQRCINHYQKLSHMYLCWLRCYFGQELFQLRIWFSTKENDWKVTWFSELFAAVVEILKRPQLWWDFVITQIQKKNLPTINWFSVWYCTFIPGCKSRSSKTMK